MRPRIRYRSSAGPAVSNTNDGLAGCPDNAPDLAHTHSMEGAHRSLSPASYSGAFSVEIETLALERRNFLSDELFETQVDELGLFDERGMRAMRYLEELRALYAIRHL